MHHIEKMGKEIYISKGLKEANKMIDNMISDVDEIPNLIR